MAEALLPTAMVPGLVTIKDKDGNQRNVYPIDAKELLATGEWELVQNGAIQAARLNANPLMMGTTAQIPQENIAAEVTGLAGSVVGSTDPEETKRMIDAADTGADGTGPDSKAPKSASAQDADNAKKSAEQSKTEPEKTAAGTTGQAAKPETKPAGAASGADKK